MAGEIFCRLQNGQLAAAFADGDFFANAYLIRRNVYLPPINVNMAVANQLTCLAARDAEAQAVDHVVKTALQLLQQKFANLQSAAKWLQTISMNFHEMVLMYQ